MCNHREEPHTVSEKRAYFEPGLAENYRGAFAGYPLPITFNTRPSRRIYPPRAQVGPTNHRSLASDAVGAPAISTSPRAGALSSESSTSLGKRARGGGVDVVVDDDDDDDSKKNPRSKFRPGGHHHQHGDDNRGNLGPPQSPLSPKVPTSPVPVGGFGEERSSPLVAGSVSRGNSDTGDARGVSSGKSVAWSKSSLGNLDMAAVLRR